MLDRARIALPTQKLARSSCVCLCVLAVHSQLLTHGFPALSSAALVNSPSSTPAGSGKHEPAAIAIKELSLLSAGEFQARPVLASQIWAAAAAHAPDPLAWSTECDVQGY